MKRDQIVEKLFQMKDTEYAALQLRIIPSAEAGMMIGVRTPKLRSFAKELFKDPDKDEFLSLLPHYYFEENQLHAFIISLEKDFDKCIAEVNRFLPFIDNWATCDQLSPKAFIKEPAKLFSHITVWIKSDKTYTVRFAVGMLMQYYLDELFDPKYADMIAEIRSDEYYINMMRAWYFATAMAKQYDSIIPYIEENRLDDWTHNKAIQKSIESKRIPDEQKLYLKTLRTGRRN
ncbi:MAG: DNA alkylation repair protein [Eubacteriaceae bacterium]|nr:DNA alkylation repair protein [Eubacteriaceae bacterium]